MVLPDMRQHVTAVLTCGVCTVLFTIWKSRLIAQDMLRTRFPRILYGTNPNINQIGQNVPVGTMKFISEQAYKILEHWDEPRETTNNSVFQNNINKTIKNEES